MRAQACLCQDLLEEGYEFVVVAKFQTELLEKRFSQYRRMNGGRFLISLREVLHSENALLCRLQLLKERINFWNENLSINTDSTEEENFIQVLLSQECNVDNLVLSPDSAEVAFTIVGYIAKKLKKRLYCNTCSNNLVESSTDCSYFLHFSRGELASPSAVLAELVCKGFALLDFHDSCIISQSYVSTRHGALCMLRHYLDNYQFM